MPRRLTVAFCALLLAGSANIASAQPGQGRPAAQVVSVDLVVPADRKVSAAVVAALKSEGEI